MFFAAEGIEFLQQFLLSGGEVGGSFDNDADVQVATSAAPELGDALIPHAENLVGLGTCRDFQEGLAIKGGNAQFGPQRRLRKTDGDLTEEIGVLTLKDGVVLHPQGDIEVSGRTTLRAVFALARELDARAGVHSGGDVDAQAFGFGNAGASPALVAGVADGLAASSAA